MRITTFAAWVWVVSFSLASPSASGRVNPNGGPLFPFTLDESGLILVPVSLGDLEVRACVLDTGASRTIISERLAARLRLRAVARAEVVSSGGVATHEVVKLPALTLAGSTRTELLATVLPSSRIRELSDDAACVIGHDFLSTHDYTIDYENRTLSWQASDDRSEEGSAHLALVLREGRYVAELPQSARPGDTVRLVPDSGASDIVLFRSAASSLPLVPMLTPPRMTLIAASGQREVSPMRVARLRVGSIELKNRPAYVVDRRSTVTGDAQGLLPLNLFARVSFRQADATMIVTAR